MNWFWITGIVVNVALTALAIVWVVRQGKPKGGSKTDDAPRME